MSRDCAITLLHENVTRYCIVGARIECAKNCRICANTSQSNNNILYLTALADLQTYLHVC